ncbi:ABC transporter permease [Capnocytophaga sp. ARDL2]|uniref:ABC transporter permease n=1 Tax=Capnocytophaga sp. ARDL2 TaxID=3238809 RepID=UPI0035570364
MITKIAWKNTWFKPLNTLLSILLLTASVAIITVIILLQKQFEEQFSRNMDDVDLVLGAKGSPLQLVLSAVYQIDAPPGNIPYDQAQEWMNHPFVEKAIPMAYGDNYMGYKIIGTTEDYITKYDGQYAEGHLFTDDFEVVVGATIAEKLDLKINDTFWGAHGDSADGEVHKDHPYTVVGILQPTGRLIDNLIVSNISSVWNVHSHEHDHDHDHEEDDHVHTEDCDHDHDEEHVHSATYNHDHSEEKEFTAVLIKMKNNMAKLNWQRLIPQNTDMQAASPILEINRLFGLFGVGLQALQYLAFGIMMLSGISIFIALYNTLKERRYELVLLRIHGAKKSQLLWLILLEGLFLCIIGYLFGAILGRIALYFISLSSTEEFKIAFNPLEFIPEKEGIVFFSTLFVGIVSALLPALRAYSLNISKTLSNAN